MPKVVYDSTRNSDVLYAVRTHILDPFFLVDTGSKKYVFLDRRDLGIFLERNKNSDMEGVLINPLLKEAEKLHESDDSFHNFALYLFQKYDLVGKPIEVPANFPFPLADFLRARGVELIPKIPLYPERAQKSSAELKAIRESIQKTEKAFALIEQILKDSSVKGASVIYHEELLTGELLKREVERLLLEEDMINSEGIIISSGAQTAIPHHPGQGPLKAHKPIVCDIFPRSRATGYFADITRTYVKGAPSAELQKMYEAVWKAQEVAMKAVRPGVKAAEVHRVATQVLLDLGYDAGEKGFVHSTGHGVGLDVHEEPRLGEKSESELKVGNVITIEPGLYYPEIGGVRVEDVVLVTEQGFENLVHHPKEWVIP